MNPTAETLELLKSAKVLDAAELAKQGIMIAQGLVAYDLEPAAKKLYPLITPLRNSITRVGGGVGTAVHWMSVTGININHLSPGVSEGHRGGSVALSTMPNVAAYKTLGHESFVTFEAEEASLPGTDNRALAILTTLQSLMQSEEMVLLGGNCDLALLQTPTPNPLQDVLTGGVFLPNTSYTVICVALTLEGFLASSVATAIPQAIPRLDADGYTDTYGGGSAQPSAPATITTANDGNSTHGIKATVAPVNGAVGYAWFWGPTAGTQLLGAITTVNSVLILAAATGTQTAASLTAADNSMNALLFDGLITQICTPGSGSYVYRMPTGTPGTGTPLTADGAGGIVEINAALEAFWNNYRLSPDIMYVNAQELLNISGRRGSCEPRPPTPPCVRFRTRRFMKYIEVVADEKA
ncbi:MAG: hypothetical protein ABSA09_08970 [Desulfobaccales bacterium]|jgi:hypothetical protein